MDYDVGWHFSASSNEDYPFTHVRPRDQTLPHYFAISKNRIISNKLDELKMLFQYTTRWNFPLYWCTQHHHKHVGVLDLVRQAVFRYHGTLADCVRRSPVPSCTIKTPTEKNFTRYSTYLHGWLRPSVKDDVAKWKKTSMSKLINRKMNLTPTKKKGKGLNCSQLSRNRYTFLLFTVIGI